MTAPVTCADMVRWYMEVYCLRTAAKRLAHPKPCSLAEALAALANPEPFAASVDVGEFCSMWNAGRSERRR